MVQSLASAVAVAVSRRRVIRARKPQTAENTLRAKNTGLAYRCSYSLIFVEPTIYMCDPLRESVPAHIMRYRSRESGVRYPGGF